MHRARVYESPLDQPMLMSVSLGYGEIRVGTYLSWRLQYYVFVSNIPGTLVYPLHGVYVECLILR